MVKATININETQDHELKSVDGGKVTLKRMSYGQLLRRRQMVSQLRMFSGDNADKYSGELNLVSEEATLFDFKNCIVDHNLEDDNGKPLDFTKPYVLRTLDSRVGSEIEQLINKQNNFEEPVEVGNESENTSSQTDESQILQLNPS